MLSPERLAVPSRLVITFRRNMFDTARRKLRGRFLDWYYSRRLAVGSFRGSEIAVLHSFMGSSPSAMMLEEMIASGARHVVEVGICGGLAPSVKVGDIILAKGAHVDEGTSSHYFDSPSSFLASERLTKRIEQVLKDNGTAFRVGDIWTTDAPYRETRSKVHRFRDKGAIGVNMESSALFAISQYRHTNVASMQVVSDLVGESIWKPSFHEKIVARHSQLVSSLAVEALAGLRLRSARS